MSKQTSCLKTYHSPVISKPTTQQATLAKMLAFLNERLVDGLAYKYVADRRGQIQLVLRADVIRDSEYYKNLYEKLAAAQKPRKSASPDTENEDPFFTVLRKVQERSTYGMHTIYEPKQLTIDGVLNEHSNK